MIIATMTPIRLAAVTGDGLITESDDIIILANTQIIASLILYASNVLHVCNS